MGAPRPELVKVRWNDAWVSGTEPINLEEVHLKHRAMQMTTLGWLLFEDEDGVSVANENYIDDDGLDTYRGRTFIPRGMILEVVPLEKQRKPRKSKPPPPQTVENALETPIPSLEKS